MDSDSDGELPSLSAIVSRIQHQKAAPTAVRKNHLYIEDPAEEAIILKGKEKSRSRRLHPGPTVDIRHAVASGHSSSSSVNAFSPSKQSTRPNSKKTDSAGPAQKPTLASTLHPSSPVSHVQKAVTANLESADAKRAHSNASGASQSGNQLESKAAPVPCNDGEKGLGNIVTEQSISRANRLLTAASCSSLLSEANNAESSCGRSLAPLTPQRVSTNRHARKQRRITIITISDSDEESERAPLPTRSRSPSKTPSLVSENASDNDELAEDISFADYSDGEASDIGLTVKKPENVRRVIEIDSSDSEYDNAAGVISWNPTPNKLKNIVKPSTLPLFPLPSSSNSNIPSDALKSRTLLVPATPKPGIEDRISTPKANKRISKARELAASSPAQIIKKATSFAKTRDELAMRLIEELNTSVFHGQLPDDLTVVWNGRLNTTAGRANWKKITNKTTRDISYRAEIELSVKVIDSEEKLKCTLAHELCHIAAWAVDKEMKPAHGPAFKSWGRKIMRVRQDIKVTTKHSYEIAYKYQWQCTNAQCRKIYGRHSKSVDTTRQACGVCSGRLVRLDKHGQPVVEASGAAGTPRKESEWAIFSKLAFKRIKLQQPSLSMTDINKLVAAEWAEVKAKKALQATSASLLAERLESLSM